MANDGKNASYAMSQRGMFLKKGLFSKNSLKAKISKNKVRIEKMANKPTLNQAKSQKWHIFKKGHIAQKSHIFVIWAIFCNISKQNKKNETDTAQYSCNCPLLRQIHE